MRWLLVSTAVLVAMLGCRNNAKRAAYLELMNAERRALEDELYELEYDYEATVKKLEESRRENEQLRGQQNESDNDFLDFSPGSDDRPGGGAPEFDLSPPTVEPGVPSTPHDELGNPERNGVRDESVRHPVSVHQRFDSSDSSDRPITHIYIDPGLTKGSDFDRRPGDDGITLVIEPRDDSGAFVPRTGAVSVVLLDYANRDRSDAASCGSLGPWTPAKPSSCSSIPIVDEAFTSTCPGQINRLNPQPFAVGRTLYDRRRPPAGDSTRYPGEHESGFSDRNRVRCGQILDGEIPRLDPAFGRPSKERRRRRAGAEWASRTPGRCPGLPGRWSRPQETRSDKTETSRSSKTHLNGRRAPSGGPTVDRVLGTV